MATIDLLNGNHLGAAASALISVSILVVMFIAHTRASHALPLHFVIWLLLCMYLFGTVTHMPLHPEKAVWSTVFPFAFFYLAGLQTGLWLSVFSLASTIVAYLMYSWFGTSLQVTFYGFTQTVGAFILCSIFAYLYEKVRTQQEQLLKQSAQCDPLTGLLNRRGFETVSDSALQQAMCAQHPVAVLLIDLDSFKQINDTQGHDAGDLLLKEVSALLRSLTRSVDIISRWGGEEFVLLLHADLEGAKQLGEKIRSAIATHQFTNGARTASIGIAIHEQQEQLEETIKRADIAMYRAKKSGKNRVEILTR
ncbi:MAG: GGDEF domain-containing protein [Gammaproteobacteria bacterium]|nr:GGDEF domain-containing protein [Gammaproteobacteria bacterium]MBU1968740.1 GGDEF domain-containing protein [Gammaproteobacteria bacterium]